MLCQTEDEDGNKFSDDDIVNHMIFLMMAAHDTSTSTATTMAYYLAANPEWQERCRDESDRLGDGPLDIEALEKLESLDLVMNESIRLVTPVQWAMRRTVRDTELLGYYMPEGTNVIAYPGMNHRLQEIWPDPMKFDPDRFAEPRNEHKKHRYALHAVRRRRAQVHRHGVRPARDQDDHAPAAAPVPARAGPPRLRAAVGLRRHAGADGRHADRAAPVALAPPLAAKRNSSAESASAGVLEFVSRVSSRPAAGSHRR